MFELQKNSIQSVAHLLSSIKCDVVYAYSILENRQQGRIFVDDLSSPHSAIFWHYCGISFVSGVSDNGDFNHELYKLLCGKYEENQRVFVLFVNDADWNGTVVRLLDGNSDVKTLERLRFSFNQKSYNDREFAIPEGYFLKETDKIIFENLEGGIIPSYSWHSSEAFLSRGKGYCLVNGKNIACNAFSSSIGNGVLDIGIETNVNYRLKGLAAPTASAMVQYCLNNGYVPNWGCNASNIGSSRIAKSLGFEIADSHPMYIKA